MTSGSEKIFEEIMADVTTYRDFTDIEILKVGEWTHLATLCHSLILV